MRLELWGSGEAGGRAYLLNEIGIACLIALIFVNVYGIYFLKKNSKSKKKIIIWGVILDIVLIIGMIFFGIVIRTTFQ